MALRGLRGPKAAGSPRYGADADHIMVKRGVDGLERAKKVLMAARYYSFFTIDVSDILDYGAMSGSGAGLTDVLGRCIGDENTRREVLSYYRGPLRIGGRSLRPSEAELSGMIGKYWRAMEALSSLFPFIATMRENEPFDLELSIDEHPPEIHAFDCLTTEAEVAFPGGKKAPRPAPPPPRAQPRGREARRLSLPRRPRRAGGEQARLAPPGAGRRRRHRQSPSRGPPVAVDPQGAEAGNGGDDPFQCFPYLQTLFADVLYDFDRETFTTWWDDTCEFARENAREGSTLAEECLKHYESEPGGFP